MALHSARAEPGLQVLRISAVSPKRKVQRTSRRGRKSRHCFGLWKVGGPWCGEERQASLEMARTMLRSREPPVVGQRVSSLRLHHGHVLGYSNPECWMPLPGLLGQEVLGKFVFLVNSYRRCWYCWCGNHSLRTAVLRQLWGLETLASVLKPFLKIHLSIWNVWQLYHQVYLFPSSLSLFLKKFNFHTS